MKLRKSNFELIRIKIVNFLGKMKVVKKAKNNLKKIIDSFELNLSW